MMSDDWIVSGHSLMGRVTEPLSHRHTQNCGSQLPLLLAVLPPGPAPASWLGLL